MGKKVVAILLLVCMVVMMAAGCADGSGTPSTGNTSTGSSSTGGTSGGDEFVIGGYYPVSGSQYGEEIVNSLNMAIEEINAQGGFNGSTVVLDSFDTQALAENAVKAVQNMIQDKVDAVIGSYNSAEVAAAAGYLNDAGIINMGMGTSVTYMQNDWPYVFRGSFNQDFGIPAYIELIKGLGITKLAIFYGQDESSASNYASFSKAVEAAGIELVTVQTGAFDDPDFTGQIVTIMNSGADAVYTVCKEVGVNFIKQLRQYGYKGLILSKDVWMTAQVDVVGQEGSNYISAIVPYVTYTDIEDCDIPNMKAFLEKYYAKYGELPQTEICYRAYDSISLLWEASKIAGKNDSDSLRDAMNTISDFEGLGGTFDFTQGDREGIHTLKAFIYADGRNQSWDTWYDAGGYDAMLAATKK